MQIPTCLSKPSPANAAKQTVVGRSCLSSLGLLHLHHANALLVTTKQRALLISMQTVISGTW